mgnify:CR=1 FL=1
MKSIAVLVVLFFLLGNCAGPMCSSAPQWTGDQPLVFDEEFVGPAGAPADPKRWQPDVGGGGWGNQELQFYTNGANTSLDGNGNLLIEARRAEQGLNCWYGPCQYTSGKLTTKVSFTQRYGRFEARMKAPAERGLWPAFWLLGDNIDAVGHPACGEIDVMETLGQDPDLVQQHAIGPGLKFGGPYPLGAGQSIADWHVYGVEWSPDAIQWLLDGRPALTLTKAAAGSSWVFDRPFYLLVNLAVGGEWPGAPSDNAPFPQRLLVDYVRVYGLSA